MDPVVLSTQWCFSVIDDILHFQTIDTNQPIIGPVAVSGVHPGTESSVTIASNDRSFTVPVAKYTALDKRFALLENNVSRRRFLSTFGQLLMNLRSVCATNDTASSDEQNSGTEHAQEDKRTFQEEVELMRRQHQQTNRVHDEFLDSSNRKWRQYCTEIFHCKDKATFGGSYREHIYCASLPECCYQELQKIFTSFSNGTLNSTKQLPSLKAGLFRFLVGCKDEPRVHRLLSRLATGLLSVEEFRTESKKLKEAGTIDTIESVKLENSRLRNENQLLKKEIVNLKRTIRNQNVFDFVDEDDEDEEPARKFQRTVIVDVHREQPNITNRETEFNGLMQRINEAQEEEIQPAAPVVQSIDQEEANKEITYSKGEKVNADWEGTWYEAVVLRVNKSKGYHIKYLVDGFKCTVSADKLKKL